MPLDRRRVPPDVARRLAALAPSSTPEAAPPGADATAGPLAGTGGTRTDVIPSVARHGWTPPPPAPAPARNRPAPSAPPRPVPALPAPGPSAPGPSARPGPSASSPSGAPGEGGPPAPASTWRPDVASALAAAAAAAEPVPVPVPRVRWAPSWRAAGSAALVLALVAGGIALRAAAAPQGEPVPIPVPVPAASAGAGEVPGADEVVVHVVGAVTAPGVVRLPLGSRVADAVAAAGGSTPDADLGTVNLARVLTDGEQLVVPVAGAPGPEPAGAPADDRVDLNHATTQELEDLPGVGPVLAGRIVQRRTERPFTSVDELDDVPGIGPALLADLRPRVRV